MPVSYSFCFVLQCFKLLFLKQYNDENLKVAIQHCEQLKADLGGTEIYPPLERIEKGKHFSAFF